MDCSATYMPLPSLFRRAGTMSISPLVGLLLGLALRPLMVAFVSVSHLPAPVRVLL